MTIISVEKSVSVDVDVDVDIDVYDVLEFIKEANQNELTDIANALSFRSVPQGLTELDALTVRHLIERVNIFGIEDMLDDLKREGERIGVYLKGGKA